MKDTAIFLSNNKPLAEFSYHTLMITLPNFLILPLIIAVTNTVITKTQKVKTKIIYHLNPIAFFWIPLRLIPKLLDNQITCD